MSAFAPRLPKAVQPLSAQLGYSRPHARTTGTGTTETGKGWPLSAGKRKLAVAISPDLRIHGLRIQRSSKSRPPRRAM